MRYVSQDEQITQTEAPPKQPIYEVKIIQRRVTVIVLDQYHPVNYVASFQAQLYGRVAIVDSINGPRFYDCLSRPGVLKDLMQRLNVTNLEGLVVKSHARLMKYALRHVATVEEIYDDIYEGHQMTWIRVKYKEETTK